jgi:hypothetical protein
MVSLLALLFSPLAFDVVLQEQHELFTVFVLVGQHYVLLMLTIVLDVKWVLLTPLSHLACFCLHCLCLVLLLSWI